MKVRAFFQKKVDWRISVERVNAFSHKLRLWLQFVDKKGSFAVMKDREEVPIVSFSFRDGTFALIDGIVVNARDVLRVTDWSDRGYVT